MVVGTMSFSSLYGGFDVPSPIYTVLWFIFDSDLYLKVVFSSSILCVSQLALSSLQSTFYSVLGLSPEIEKSMGPGSLQVGTVGAIPRSLHKPVLHRWLTQLNSTADLSPLFQDSSSSVAQPINPLFSPLYKSVSLLRRDHVSVSSLQNLLPLFSSSISDSHNFSIGTSPLRSILLDFTELRPSSTGIAVMQEKEFTQ